MYIGSMGSMGIYEPLAHLRRFILVILYTYSQSIRLEKLWRCGEEQYRLSGYFDRDLRKPELLGLGLTLHDIVAWGISRTSKLRDLSFARARLQHSRPTRLRESAVTSVTVDLCQAWKYAVRRPLSKCTSASLKKKPNADSHTGSKRGDIVGCGCPSWIWAMVFCGPELESRMVVSDECTPNT